MLSGVRLSGSRLQDGDLHAEVYWDGCSQEQHLLKNSDLSLKIWIAPREGGMTLDEATLPLSLLPAPFKTIFLVRTFKFYPLSKFQ